MKKQILFAAQSRKGVRYRADGKPADFGTGGRFGASDYARLVVIGRDCEVRLSDTNKKHVIVSGVYESRDELRFLSNDLGLVGSQEKWERNPYGLPNAHRCIFKTEASALRCATVLNDVVALGKVLAGISEYTFTVDPAYAGGGRVITCGSVTYYIPFNEAEYKKRNTIHVENAEIEKKVAFLKKESEEAGNTAAQLAAETLTLQTKTGTKRTLLYLGIAVVAALVIGGIVFIVSKTKKK